MKKAIMVIAIVSLIAVTAFTFMNQKEYPYELTGSKLEKTLSEIKSVNEEFEAMLNKAKVFQLENKEYAITLECNSEQYDDYLVFLLDENLKIINTYISEESSEVLAIKDADKQVIAVNKNSDLMSTLVKFGDPAILNHIADSVRDFGYYIERLLPRLYTSDHIYVEKHYNSGRRFNGYIFYKGKPIVLMHLYQSGNGEYECTFLGYPPR